MDQPPRNPDVEGSHVLFSHVLQCHDRRVDCARVQKQYAKIASLLKPKTTMVVGLATHTHVTPRIPESQETRLLPL
jgi:hypothetical protein